MVKRTEPTSLPAQPVANASNTTEYKQGLGNIKNGFVNKIRTLKLVSRDRAEIEQTFGPFPEVDSFAVGNNQRKEISPRDPHAVSSREQNASQRPLNELTTQILPPTGVQSTQGSRVNTDNDPYVDFVRKLLAAVGIKVRPKSGSESSLPSIEASASARSTSPQPSGSASIKPTSDNTTGERRQVYGIITRSWSLKKPTETTHDLPSGASQLTDSQVSLEPKRASTPSTTLPTVQEEPDANSVSGKIFKSPGGLEQLLGNISQGRDSSTSRSISTYARSDSTVSSGYGHAYPLPDYTHLRAETESLPGSDPVSPFSGLTKRDADSDFGSDNGSRSGNKPKNR